MDEERNGNPNTTEGEQIEQINSTEKLEESTLQNDQSDSTVQEENTLESEKQVTEDPDSVDKKSESTTDEKVEQEVEREEDDTVEEVESDSTLRQRKGQKEEVEDEHVTDDVDDKLKDSNGEGRLLGVTEDRQTFYLPKTKNPLTLHPISEWSVFEWIKNASLLNILLLFFGCPRWFFICLFLFWRLAYNVGLGYILARQSKDKFVTRLFEKITPNSPYYATVKQVLKLGMGDDYDFDSYPPAFNAWVAFRYLVDIILANDLVCYFVFCLACWEWPESFSFTLIICYVVGLGLCFFTLWAKTDAYRVVKDFAWYWGDFFFLVDQRLTFDRVFSISPHPMYTIGYAFFYGASLITQSYTVLYVSLLGHFCQLAFLSIVENPHIEKTYPGIVEDRNSERNKILYDAQTGYFRKDLIVFKNFDPFRSSDLFVFIILFYSFLLSFLNLPIWFYIGHALLWRMFHSLGLGYILKAQSENNYWTDHFINQGYNKQFAFDNWKKIFNLSLMMTHASFGLCFLQYLSSCFDFNFYGLRQTAGIILIAVNIWSSVSVYEVLGEFGWFYGDFFIDEVPSTVYYTGIYRFVNNPDSVTGFAAYYGLALICGSLPVLGTALISQGINQIFLKFVEEPHMKRVYGNSVRQQSGIELAITEIVNEAVEQSPHLRVLKDSANVLKKDIEKRANTFKGKAKDQVSKIKSTLGEQTKGRFPC